MINPACSSDLSLAVSVRGVISSRTLSISLNLAGPPVR